MTLPNHVAGKRITLLGLGRFGGGIAAAKFLVAQGARVLVTDKEPREKLEASVAQLAGLPIEFRLGADQQRESDFSSADLIVTSPAVAPNNPLLAAARAAGVPITTEICLFVERCPARQIIGVTGTKGKSTTTALLGRMLQTARRTWVGGNIGKSLLEDLPSIAQGDLVLLELSSFMLHFLAEEKWSPHVAVVSMISADHLDWHGSQDAYIADKKQIVRNQSADDFAVLCGESDGARAFANGAAAKISYYTQTSAPPFDLLIPGKHNQLNAQGAFAAAKLFGVTHAQAQQAVRDFRGLAHRLELVHESNGVRWYNDSIATIPEAAIAALGAFPDRTVIQIVGGYDKGLPFDSMCTELANHARAVLTIGAVGDRIAQAVRTHAAGADVRACENLATAVGVAHRTARPGDVVLLSTGCASYDQFTNFEERGVKFAELARA